MTTQNAPAGKERPFERPVFHHGFAGIVLGRKALPLAVDRNRVRRLLRVRLEAARPAIERYDLVLRLKKRAARAEIPLIAAEAERLLAAIVTTGEAA